MLCTLDISNYETMRPNDVSFKYQMFTPSGC